tara:strand:+ start:1895 stop:2077 length:183 start_codon:yes stop_codon:yes gene_type:complete
MSNKNEWKVVMGVDLNRAKAEALCEAMSNLGLAVSIDAMMIDLTIPRDSVSLIRPAGDSA